MLLTLKAFNKEIQAKKNFPDSHVYNSFRIFDV